MSVWRYSVLDQACPEEWSGTASIHTTEAGAGAGAGAGSSGDYCGWTRPPLVVVEAEKCVIVDNLVRSCMSGFHACFGLLLPDVVPGCYRDQAVLELLGSSEVIVPPGVRLERLYASLGVPGLSTQVTISPVGPLEEVGVRVWKDVVLTC